MKCWERIAEMEMKCKNMLRHVKTVKNKSEEESLHRFYVRAFLMLCVRFPWMLNSGLQFTDLGRRKCDVQFTIWQFWPLFETTFNCVSQCIYRRHSVRSGKKTSVIFAGHSLSGNRAMGSFLEAIWKHSEICHPKHPQTIFVLFKWGQSLQKSYVAKKHWHKASDMSWFGLLHFSSEELATATFMETDQNALRCPKCILNEAQTVTPAVQPQKAKHSHSAATTEI